MKRAFTLIELLVVVAIIAVLIALLLPALNAAKKQARESVCMSNMRQLGIGWIAYTVESGGYLPGSGYDTTTFRGWTGQARTWCWLGTRSDTNSWTNLTNVKKYVPMSGSIFKYVGEQPGVYKCPEDALTKLVEKGSQAFEKPPYSYTAPVMLTGAPVELLVRTRFPETFDSSWNDLKDWNKATGHASPWMIVEEDERFRLAEFLDSAWCNVDEIADRHRGRGAIAHADGSGTMRGFQKNPAPLTAWKVYYELSDGRIVSAGSWENPNPRFGYLKSSAAKGLNQ